MTKKYTYYPGCASQASGMHLETSMRAILPKLGVELESIDDWNCCGASIGHLEAGVVGNAALSARNLAHAREKGTADVVTACPACYLNTHGTNEKMRDKAEFKAKMKEALAAGGIDYDADLHVRHMVEVLVNDIGMDAIKGQVTNPLKGLKVAGYIGCQTVRPFANTERGGEYDTYDQPEFLDDFVEACGAEAVPFRNKTSCCGGAVSLMAPEKTLDLMRKILQEAKDRGADCICTPCALCQQNVEMYQDKVNAAFGTAFQIPVVFHTQLMAVAFGLDAKKDAALHQQLIPCDKLAGMAKK